MKQTTIILLALLIFASCNNDPNTPTPNNPNPNNPSITAHWIPNWSTDTLVAIYQETQGGAMKFDSIFSFSRGDTSLIKYKGIEYYLWTKPNDQYQTNNPNWYVANEAIYPYCYFGTVAMDNGSAITGGIMTAAVPPTYYSSNTQSWKPQPQSLMINPRKPPFPNNYFTGGDLFSTSNK